MERKIFEHWRLYTNKNNVISNSLKISIFLLLTAQLHALHNTESRCDAKYDEFEENNKNHLVNTSMTRVGPNTCPPHNSHEIISCLLILCRAPFSPIPLGKNYVYI